MNAKFITAALSAVIFMSLATLTCVFASSDCCKCTLIVADIIFAVLCLLSTFFIFFRERLQVYSKELKSEVKSLEANLANLQTSIKEKQSEIERYNASIAQLKKDVNALEGIDKVKLNAELEGQKQKNAVLQQQYDELARAVIPLISKISENNE